MSLEDRKSQLANCNRCSNCKWVPVVRSNEFAHICPSVVYGKFHSYSASGMLINGYSLLEGTVGYSEALIDSVYACSMCGGCDVSCKTNFGDLIEPLESLYALRERVMSAGKAPAALQVIGRHLRAVGNPFGQPSARRGDWCADLDLTPKCGGAAEVLLHVGDAAFDASQWPQIRFAVEVLQQAGVTLAIGGVNEPDSGALAHDIGLPELAAEFATRTADWIRGNGVRLVVTCSDAGFAAFRGVYPRLGVTLGDVRIQHFTEWFSARPQPQPLAAHTEQGDLITYHDSCRLGRLSEPYQPWTGKWEVALNSLPVRTDATPTRFGTEGVYDAPRQVLAAAGAHIVEMDRNREAAFCCGAGGGAALAHPAFAAKAARHRLDEALATGAGVLVTSCGGCSQHLRAIAESDRLPLRVLTIAEYLQHKGKAAAAKSVGEVA